MRLKLLVCCGVVAVVGAGACHTVIPPLGGSTPTPGPLQAGAAAAVQTTNGTVLRLTLNVGTAADGCLLAALSLGSNFAAATLTWDSGGAAAQTMTPVTSQSNGTLQVILEKLPAPSPGTHFLSASWTPRSSAVLGAVALSGADQTECVGGFTSSTGSSASPAVTVSSSAGHLSLGFALAGSPLQSVGQTTDWNLASAGGVGAALVQSSQSFAALNNGTLTLPNLPHPGNTLVFIGGNDTEQLNAVTGGGGLFTPYAFNVFPLGVEIWIATVGTNPITTIHYSSVTATGPSRGTVMEWSGLGAPNVATVSDGVGPSAVASVPPKSVPEGEVAFVSVAAAGVTPVIPGNGPWVTGPVVNDGSATEEVWFRTVTSTTSMTAASPFGATENWGEALLALTVPGLCAPVGSAASTAPGQATVVHQWTTAAPGAWTTVGVDILPAR